MVAEGSVQIGVHTNNTAEIQALSLGIQRAKELGLCQVEAINDSALVTNWILDQDKKYDPVNGSRIHDYPRCHVGIMYGPLPKIKGQRALSLMNLRSGLDPRNFPTRHELLLFTLSKKTS